MAANTVVAQAVFILNMVAWLHLSQAAVYKVGDSAGWTSIGNIDYKQWATTKTFQIGDVIIFEYNAQFHNVMRVTHAMYRACNTSAPLATYTTGNDSITITTKAHHFFLCGVPGHCQAGQKVDINVLRSPETVTASAPTGSTTTPPWVPSVSVPGPSGNTAFSLKASKGSFAKLCVSMVAFAVFVLAY